MRFVAVVRMTDVTISLYPTREQIEVLLDAGFSDANVAKIMGENVKRVLLETLPR